MKKPTFITVFGKYKRNTGMSVLFNCSKKCPSHINRSFKHLGVNEVAFKTNRASNPTTAVGTRLYSERHQTENDKTESKLMMLDPNGMDDNDSLGG